MLLCLYVQQKLVPWLSLSIKLLSAAFHIGGSCNLQRGVRRGLVIEVCISAMQPDLPRELLPWPVAAAACLIISIRCSWVLWLVKHSGMVNAQGLLLYHIWLLL
jgi:hypothetical protein